MTCGRDCDRKIDPLETIDNINGGLPGQVVYQKDVSETTFSNQGSNGEVLTVVNNKPTFTSLPSSNPGGLAGQVLYQSAPSTTTYTNTGTNGSFLGVVNNVPSFTTLPPSNPGGSVGQVLYQSAPSTTTYTNTGNDGDVLTIVNSIPTFQSYIPLAPTIHQIIGTNEDFNTYYQTPQFCRYIKVTLVAGGGGCAAIGLTPATHAAGGGGGAGMIGIFPPGLYSIQVGQYGDGGKTEIPFDGAVAGGSSLFSKVGTPGLIELTGGGPASSAIFVVPSIGGSGGTATNSTPFKVILANGGTGMDGEEFAVGQLPTTSYGGGSIVSPSGGAQNYQGDALPGSGRGGTLLSNVAGRTGNGGSGQVYIEEYY